MKMIIQILLFSVIFLFSSLVNTSLADENDIKFTLKILPKQQKVEITTDNASRSGITLKSEFVKLNTVTNNYHIKVTIINGSGQVLYHQLALIEKIKGSEIEYPDGTIDYQDNTGIPYYNYGNIKENKMAMREWYLSNTGKDEIEIKGHIISKEIPVSIDSKILQADPNLTATLTTYYSAMRDNDLNTLLSTIPQSYSGGNVVRKYTDGYNLYPGKFPQILKYISQPYDIVITNGFCYIYYKWLSPNDGAWHEGGLELQQDLAGTWWITR